MIKEILLTGGLLLAAIVLRAQELYVFTDPASNLPANSASAKLTARYTRNQYTTNLAQRYNAEWMMGLNKTLMLKMGGSFSDFYSSGLRWESVKGYVKWRFYSKDGIHRHFRVAAFADGAYSRNDMVYDEMNLDGDNKGVQAGVIATQLIQKLAISGSVSFMRIFDERFKEASHRAIHDQNSVNYSLSAGYLLFPREYSNYKQVNGNLYLEALGASGLEQGMDYLDLAPSFQLIFASATKLNLGARFQAAGNMTRIARNNYFIGVETAFLNLLKRNETKKETKAL